MKILIKTKLIKQFIEQNNMTKTAFCKKCKISVGTFNKIISNKNNFKINALIKIARILNVQLYEMFND